MAVELRSWLANQLSELLGLDGTEEMADYVMALEEGAILEYMTQLLGASKETRDFTANLVARLREIRVRAHHEPPSARIVTATARCAHGSTRQRSRSCARTRKRPTKRTCHREAGGAGTWARPRSRAWETYP